MKFESATACRFVLAPAPAAPAAMAAPSCMVWLCLDEATAALTDGREPGDIVITLGAGDVNRVCTDREAALNER